jgi:hypothetical protein
LYEYVRENLKNNEEDDEDEDKFEDEDENVIEIARYYIL